MSAPGAPGESDVPSNHPRSKRLALFGGIAAILVVLIVALGFANVIPGFHLGAGGGGGGSPPTTPATYGLTFGETGLPDGTSWSITLGSAAHSSTGSSVTFTEANGTYPYSVGTVAGYTADPASGTQTVDGKAVSVSITFTAVGSGSPSTYPVTFTENGLASGTSWSVTLASAPQGSTGTTVTFTEANGTYPFSVGAVSGFQASPPSGSVTVAGKSVSQTVTFRPNPPKTYSIAFNETGLPVGTSWSVTLSPTSVFGETTSITLAEPNGSYSYSVAAVGGYRANPSSGSVTVAGKPVSVNVTFTSSSPPPAPGGQYPLNYTQVGLPVNISWYVLLITGTAPYASNASEFGEFAQGGAIEFGVPNGTYTWSVLTQSTSYAPVPSEGNLTVAGQSVNISIEFAQLLPTTTSYSVTFGETGLPNGGTWYATLNSTTSFSSTTFSAGAGRSIAFSVPNGTYDFNVSASALGYLATTASGSVTVDGAAVSVAIVFAPSYAVTFQETGVAVNLYWEVIFDGQQWTESPGVNLALPAFNGSYAFATFSPGYRASPASGTVVVQGRAVAESIRFTAVASYPVTFTETGLSATTPWMADLQLDGTLFENGSFSVSSTLIVWAANGNYTWQVTPILIGYLATPMTGAVDVNNSGTSVNVVFVPVPTTQELIEFYEEQSSYAGAYDGLPNGTSWNVTLGGVTESTAGPLLGFLEPNGTYSYTIGPPSGYSVLPESGTLTVNSTNPANPYSPAAEVFVAFLPVSADPPLAAGPGHGLPTPGTPPPASLLAPGSGGARPAPQSGGPAPAR